MTDAVDDLKDRAAAAALALVQDRPWPQVSLRDIAAKADIPLADLYVHTSSKPAVIDWLARRYDLAALGGAVDDGAEAHDRLFDSVMRRLEAMEAHRASLLAIQASEGLAPIARRLPRTARAILEGAGVDASGRKGAARVAAMSLVWGRVLQVWRADQGALNRTMAEVDRRLKQMRRALERTGAGF
jgi:AcrR family transcriptional regulator